MLYIQYIRTLHVCMSISGIVIHYVEWILVPFFPCLSERPCLHLHLEEVSLVSIDCLLCLMSSVTLSSSAGNGLAVDWSEFAALLLNWTLCTSHCWWNLIQLPLCAENCGTLPCFQLVRVVWYVWSCSWWCICHQGC